MIEYSEYFYKSEPRALPPSALYPGVQRFARDTATREKRREPAEKSSPTPMVSNAKPRKVGIELITQPTKSERTQQRAQQRYTEADALTKPTHFLLRLVRTSQRKDPRTGGASGFNVHAECTGPTCEGKGLVAMPLRDWMQGTGAKGCKRCRHTRARAIHKAAVVIMPREIKPFFQERRRA